MQISDSCLSWLKKKFSVDVIAEVWLFGSAARSQGGYRDVDLFVKYRDGCSKDIVHLRRVAEEDFKISFGMPLHVLALSEIESQQSLQFLEKALHGAVRITKISESRVTSGGSFPL